MPSVVEPPVDQVVGIYPVILVAPIPMLSSLPERNPKA